MAFLIEEFGQDRGSALFDTQEQLFHTLIESKNTENKSKSQQKTLIQTILPCVALYKTLLQEGFSEEEKQVLLKGIGRLNNFLQHRIEKMEASK